MGPMCEGGHLRELISITHLEIWRLNLIHWILGFGIHFLLRDKRRKERLILHFALERESMRGRDERRRNFTKEERIYI